MPKIPLQISPANFLAMMNGNRSHVKLSYSTTTYIPLVWEKLTVNDLERIEKVKASFMKRVMGVGMNAPSRMAYVLMGELFLIEEIRLSGMLPTTKTYQDLITKKYHVFAPMGRFR